ncbi:MAG: aminopeptidase P family protein [Clostridiales bacterium]|jgi:Xaa-Pro aminopeptidase|nr:aminopeptidase P family protein [Clostridiales bacterium]
MYRIEEMFNKLPYEVDCALITSDKNRQYFTGLKSSAGTLLCFREKSYLIIDFRYIEKAKATVKSYEVIEQDSIFKQIENLIKKHGAKRIAVEADKMTISELNSYSTKLSECEFDTSDSLSKVISRMRMVKDKHEIEKISQAQEIAEKAFEHILDFIKVGRTEREIELELNWAMLKNGAEAISFDSIVLSGKNTSMPHGVPSNKRVESGDFVLMDFGAVIDGYHSDMTRTVCVGKPTAEMINVYSIVLSAQENAIKSARAGIRGKDLDRSARKIIEDVGYGSAFGHSLGHGVGLDIHEMPTASQMSETILEKNMLVTIEPGIYLPEKFGVRIEDLVVIKEDFCINLNKTSKKMICI